MICSLSNTKITGSEEGTKDLPMGSEENLTLSICQPHPGAKSLIPFLPHHPHVKRYSISGAGSSDLSSKMGSVQSVASPQKLPVALKASNDQKPAEGRRAALALLASALFTTAVASSANAGVIEEYLEKSKANKELNDKKRLATSGANFARAYTVEFGTCKFPENFTGCQDLAKQKKVPFISDDLELECKGKDKYKCGSNVFWKW